MDILELSEKLKKGSITSLEITKDYLAKIKKLDPQIKSYITVSEETAIQEAEESDKRRAKNKILSLIICQESDNRTLKCAVIPEHVKNY